MSFLMAALLAAQREQAAFERLVSQAPALGLPRADRASVGRLLPLIDDADLEGLLRQALQPARTLSTIALIKTTAARMRTPQAVRARAKYPLDSPQLLRAARAHGIDGQILAEVARELEREGK